MHAPSHVFTALYHTCRLEEVRVEEAFLDLSTTAKVFMHASYYSMHHTILCISRPEYYSKGVYPHHSLHVDMYPIASLVSWVGMAFLR